jgi:hypothetical protein
MEGIMNLPANVGGATSQDGLDSFAPLIAAQQAARDMGYPRFTRELLSAGAEMDQAEVQEFLQTIRDAGLTSEDVALMRRVVEAVFGDPNNYPEVRARLLAEGVPEDILPETFDLEFFVALRMAVEEAENLSQEPRPTEQDMPMDMPVQMAEGGIVGLPQMTPIAREMAAMGRNGDTMLAHITPQEAMMLQRMGGSGTINPYTGLPEFFLKKLFRGVGKAIKSVGKAVKKFAKSTVGRVVLSVALGAFLGPMATGFLSGMGVTVGAAAATGISAGIGVFGSSLLAGDGFKNSLRNGLTAGALSFGVAGVTQAGGFSAPATNAPANFAQGYEQGVANIKAPFQAAADFIRGGPESGVGTAKDLVAQPAVSDSTAQLGQGPQGLTGKEYFQASPGAEGFSSQEFNRNLLANKAVDPMTLQPSSLQLGDVPGAGSAYTGQDFGIKAGVDPVTSKAFPQGQYPLPGVAPSSITGPELGAPLNRIQPLSPANAPAVAPGAATSSAGPTMIDRAQSFYQDPSVKSFGNIFYDASAKTTLGKLAPGLTTAGITYLASGDPFKVPEQEPGESDEAYAARRDAAVAKLRQESPEFFGSFLASPNQGIMSTQPAYSFQPVMTAARGSGPKGVENFPRKNGAINGPGTGTSDDIPAMLSDGEFVFTAKSVRNMGGGSRRKGAAKMYKLMKMLEGGPVSKTAEA